MKESKNNIPLKKIKPWKKELDSQKIAEHKIALPTTNRSMGRRW
jgi:hypothetical protein